MKSLKELIDQKAQLIKDNEKLLDSCGGRPNVEQAAEWDRRDADVNEINKEILAINKGQEIAEKQRKRGEELAQVVERQTESSKPGKRGESEELSIDFGRGGLLNLSEIDNDSVAENLRERATPSYSKAFKNYLRTGRVNEALGMMVGDNSKGGYAVPTGFLSMLIKFVDDASTIRGLATVLAPTTEKSVGCLSYDTDYADADWSPEVPASDISEDSAARFGRRELTPHLFSKAVRASRKMLRSSTLNVESFLAQRLAYKFAITENKAFMTGDGADQPLGVFTASSDGIPTTRDTTCASATTFTADELIDLQHSVKDVYRGRGVWIASRTFRKICRKLKDGNGQYLMTLNTASGIDTLLERPLVIDENAPSTFTTGQYIALFGDMSFYYIQDGLGMDIQRLDEIAARKNQVEWIGRKETDGMPVLAEAFARLKLG